MGLNQLLAQQGGVVSRSQALACGISTRTIARRVASREWRVLFRGVYLVGGHPVTDAVRVRAAWLACGERSTVTGPAAAFWFGLRDRAPGRIAITLPRTARCGTRPGVLLRRRDLAPPDRVSYDGVALTALPLTVLETAIVPGSGPAFLDRALQKYVGFGELHAAYCRNNGAHGMLRAGELLIAAADRADSAAERRLLRLLREAGITGYVRGLAVGPWLLDVAFPRSRVWLEVDGWAWHADVERFRADRRKQNALVADGWTVLRFTWADLTDTPDDTVRRVRAALRSP